MSKALPETSYLAKDAFSSETKEKHHQKILEALLVLKCATGEQISVQAGMDYHAVMRRLSELERDEKVYKPLTTGLTSKGRKAFHYCLRTPDTIVPTPEKYNPKNDTAHEYVDGLIQIAENHKKEKEKIISGRQQELF